MKTLYEVNWHYDNDTLARISVSPIKVLREGILPGCSSVSITAVDSNGREFLGCPRDYFETEESAWEQTKVELQETIESEERDVYEAQRRIEGLRNVLLAIQGAEPVRETGPVVTDEMIEALQRILDTAMRWALVARIPECGEFSGIAQDAGWLLDALRTADQHPSPDVSALVGALEAIQKASTLKGVPTGAQVGAALGRIAAICDVTLAAHRKGAKS